MASLNYDWLTALAHAQFAYFGQAGHATVLLVWPFSSQIIQSWLFRNPFGRQKIRLLANLK